MKKFILKEIRSFKYAFNGIRWLVLERHFMIHLVFALAAIILGVLLEISQTEWLAIIICITLVITAEAINTVIEKTIDYISLDKTPMAKKIKDMSAGMVLVTAISSIIIGVLVFLF